MGWSAQCDWGRQVSVIVAVMNDFAFALRHFPRAGTDPTIVSRARRAISAPESAASAVGMGVGGDRTVVGEAEGARVRQWERNFNLTTARLPLRTALVKRAPRRCHLLVPFQRPFQRPRFPSWRAASLLVPNVWSGPRRLAHHRIYDIRPAVAGVPDLKTYSDRGLMNRATRLLQSAAVRVLQRNGAGVRCCVLTDPERYRDPPNTGNLPAPSIVFPPSCADPLATRPRFSYLQPTALGATDR